MNKYMLAVVGTALVIIAFYQVNSKPSNAFTINKATLENTPSLPVPPRSYKIASAQITTARQYIKKHRYNSDLCFLIDMGLPSGKNRFFVYDLKQDSIINSGLVTHGRCGERWLEGRKYSNEVGSMCTSLGHYKVGSSYQGKFGLAFKLYGLDSSNSNAFKRYVVLHSHSCIPENESSGEICQSDGCPTVSPGFLSLLQKKINTSSSPVLLTIFD